MKTTLPTPRYQAPQADDRCDALIDGSVINTDTPEIVSDVQIANLHKEHFVLKTGRAKIAYAPAAGLQVFANGSTGVPFQVAANASSRPMHGWWRCKDERAA